MPGSLTFYTGPMLSGKTLELIRHLQIYAEQHMPTVCIRPVTDTRTEQVKSRAGLSFNGLMIDGTDMETVRRLTEEYDVIGVDESQFFSPDIVPVLQDAVRRGKTILVAGIDTDFRGDVFPTALALLALPETNVERLRAVCSVCRQHNATRSQRLKNGEPAGRDEPTVVIENLNSVVTYEPRCLEHHVIL
jgi:thymidine kinase